MTPTPSHRSLHLRVIPTLDDPGILPRFYARIFIKVLRRAERILASHDLTHPQLDVLTTLAAGEGISQQDLAERLLVTKGNICGLINRLEEASLVRREEDAADARIRRLYLTPAGRRKLATLGPVFKQLDAPFYAALSRPDQEALLRILATLETDLDKTDT